MGGLYQSHLKTDGDIVQQSCVGHEKVGYDYLGGYCSEQHRSLDIDEDDCQNEILPII